jgi:predicted glycoside hydrolase/deacetylase ChbG (UPF0249 family)
MQKSPNPLLKKLGFSNTDRVQILHADDIGMCQATINAYAHLDEFGAVSSGSVMVPCPWFLAAAEYARSHPETDLGIHLTLNSEWSEYRWSPLSTRDPNSSLVDKQGFFYTYHEQPQEFSEVEEVRAEISAQIELAIRSGMNPTHVDTHMLTLVHPRFLRTYLETAYHFGLPAMVPKFDQEEWQKTGFFTPDESRVLAEIVDEFEQRGFPMLDSFSGLKLTVASQRLEQATQALGTLPAGIHHFYIHPSLDTPEARAISPDWQGRVADYETFLLPELKDFLKKEGIQLIGYRAIQELMPV